MHPMPTIAWVHAAYLTWHTLTSILLFALNTYLYLTLTIALLAFLLTLLRVSTFPIAVYALYILHIVQLFHPCWHKLLLKSIHPHRAS